MKDTSVQEPTSNASKLTDKLSRMLQNMSVRWSKWHLLTHQGGFGAYLDERTSLFVTVRGPLRREDLSRLLALFAVWLEVEPERWDVGTTRAVGPSSEVTVHRCSRPGLQRFRAYAVCEECGWIQPPWYTVCLACDMLTPRGVDQVV